MGRFRSYALAPAAFGIIAIAVVVAWLVLTGSSEADDASIPNVTVSQLADGGIRAAKPDPGDEPGVAAEAALHAATVGNPDGTALGIVLVRFQDQGQFKEPHLAWAVSLDPETNPAIPHLGPGGTDIAPAVAFDPNLKATFIVVFVDAKNGERLFRYESSPLE